MQNSLNLAQSIEVFENPTSHSEKRMWVSIEFFIES